MKRQRHFIRLTLVVSILAGIIFPLIMSSKQIDRDRFFYVMALSFSLTWAIYSIIFLGYVFLIEGRRNRNRSETRREDPFSLHLIQEREALWKITAGKHKDPGMGNPNWN